MIIRQHYLVRTLAQNDKNAALGLDRLQSDAWTFLCLYLLHTIHNRNHWNKYAYTDHANRNKKHKSTFGRKTVFSNQLGVACLGKNVFKRLSLCRRCMSEGLLICGSLALLKSKWRRVGEHATAQNAHQTKNQPCLCMLVHCMVWYCTSPAERHHGKLSRHFRSSAQLWIPDGNADCCISPELAET